MRVRLALLLLASLLLIVSGIALVILSLANRLTPNPFGPRQSAL